MCDNINNIRRELINKRLNLNPIEVIEKSKQIQEKFISLNEYRNAKHICLYMSIKNEVLTDLIFEDSIKKNKIVVFPKVIRESGELKFFEVNRSLDFIKGIYEIMEPKGNSAREYELKDVNIVVVPGVAFDTNGNRLGYGKGFYDRALSGLEDGILRVGIAYDFQIVKGLQVRVKDASLDLIITELRTIDLRERNN